MPIGRPGSPSRDRTAASPQANKALGINASLVTADGSRFPAKLSEIAPSPRNVREKWEWEETEFQEFAANLKEVGQVQDGVVASVEVYLGKWPGDAGAFGPETRWVLIAGERRFRAAVANGDEDMPVVLRNEMVLKGDRALLSENQWRRSFSPLQEGQLYARIRAEEGLSYAQIAAELGRSNPGATKAEISKRVRLYEDFPEGEARRDIHRGRLGVEPAYHLLTQLGDPQMIEQAYALMGAEGLTARRAVERLTGTGGVSSAKRSPEPAADPGSTPETAEGVSSAKRSEAEDPTAGEPTVSSAKRSPEPAADPGSGPQGSVAAEPGSTPETAEGVSPAKRRRSNHETVARLKAGQRLLTARVYKTPDDVTLRLAQTLIVDANKQYLSVAATLLGFDAEDQQLASGPRPAFLAYLSASEDDTFLVRVADAVALAAVELDYRDADSRAWDERHADYLRQLQEHADYQPTTAETEFLSSPGVRHE
ncbi:ParB N-terminal domain-containing protein [Streptosporangium sp. NPDC002524]|uniref:ParB N-terminal domain-containing protein n=1 Tax=Streptosporangium sp. NPDC002524 TaxID=3154537 RepID=UPI00331BF1D6